MAAARKSAQSGKFKGSVTTVSAPLVQVRIGSQVLHLFHGDIVPDGVSQDQLDHLSDLGYLAESEAPTPGDESDDNE